MPGHPQKKEVIARSASTTDHCLVLVPRKAKSKMPRDHLRKKERLDTQPRPTNLPARTLLILTVKKSFGRLSVEHRRWVRGQIPSLLPFSDSSVLAYVTASDLSTHALRPVHAHWSHSAQLPYHQQAYKYANGIGSTHRENT